MERKTDRELTSSKRQGKSTLELSRMETSCKASGNILISHTSRDPSDLTSQKERVHGTSLTAMWLRESTLRRSVPMFQEMRSSLLGRQPATLHAENKG